MKSRLDQLTVSQFIDMASGNTRVLLERGEFASPANLADAMRGIVFEFKEICDAPGVKQYVMQIERLTKAKINRLLFTMCSNMINLKAHASAREVLAAYGVKVHHMNDTRLEAEIASRLERAKATIEKIEAEKNKCDKEEKTDIRKAFEAQTAAIMAHFKFQIDINTMSASLFAHLIARYNTEMKAILAARKNR